MCLFFNFICILNLLKSLKKKGFPYPNVIPCTRYPLLIIVCSKVIKQHKDKDVWERRVSVVECLTRDRGAAGLSLTGSTALYP